MRRHIPNIITLMNLLCGSAAVILALWEFYYAAWFFIIFAALFDFCDGFFARLLHAYSEVGKELDSLSDLVSFGLAPAVMFFSIYYHGNHNYTLLAFISLMIVAFSALRLAKFNVDSRQSVDFIGLPTPANAMIVASLAAYYDVSLRVGHFGVVFNLLNSGWFIPVASVVLSILLVSEIPMFSMKKKRLSFRESPLVMTFLVATAAIVVAGELFYPHKSFVLGNIPLWIAISFFLYLLLNLISAPFKSLRPSA